MRLNQARNSFITWLPYSFPVHLAHSWGLSISDAMARQRLSLHHPTSSTSCLYSDSSRSQSCHEDQSASLFRKWHQETGKGMRKWETKRKVADKGCVSKQAPIVSETDSPQCRIQASVLSIPWGARSWILMRPLRLVVGWRLLWIWGHVNSPALLPTPADVDRRCRRAGRGKPVAHTGAFKPEERERSSNVIVYTMCQNFQRADLSHRP